jgi:hypothetical protein
LHLSLFFVAETFEGRRTEKIEIYIQTSRGSSERERERAHIEADAGADTKTTTKIRKRKNKRKKNKRAIKTHTWLTGLRRKGLNMLERPDER